LEENERNTVVIQYDSFMHDYITDNDSPFLSLLKDQDISGSFVSTFGFEIDGLPRRFKTYVFLGE